jgi:hypothetical protein
MRTTIDLPDDLFGTLKTRASLRGMTLRELIQELIEHGLRQPPAPEPGPGKAPPPVIIEPRGVPIALSAEDLRRMEEEEDLARIGRSA